MFPFRVIAVGAVVVWSATGASIVSGDARRGEQLFQSEQCVQCHSLKGKGGTLAPDLARRVDRDYTPAVMASLMWNHAPDMWAAMARQGVRVNSVAPGSIEFAGGVWEQRSLRLLAINVGHEVVLFTLQGTLLVVLR